MSEYKSKDEYYLSVIRELRARIEELEAQVHLLSAEKVMLQATIHALQQDTEGGNRG